MNTQFAKNCPSCGSEKIECVGAIFNNNYFAGKYVNFNLKRYLWKCKSCYLYFAYPRLSIEELNKFYKLGNPSNWQYTMEDRKDWQIAVEFIKKHLKQGSKILDIGCWDGSFLSYLSGYELYGVEINKEASLKANHIKLIAEDLYTLHKWSYQNFFDVIEHVIDPLDFLSMLKSLTAKGGYIIISSGNTEAKTWKIAKSKYWYCSILEHMSFINKNWCELAADKLGIKVVYFQKFSHVRRSHKRLIYETLLNLIYLLSPYVIAYLRRLKDKEPKPLNYYLYPPSWAQSKDHLLVIFRV